MRVLWRRLLTVLLWIPSAPIILLAGMLAAIAAPISVLLDMLSDDAAE